MQLNIEKEDLGHAWLGLMKAICDHGNVVGNEIIETRNISVAFSRASEQDDILEKYAIKKNISEMQKVFFSKEANIFGHNYRDNITGPLGRKDFSDVVEVLRIDPFTKRALVYLTGNNNGKVPCINTVHFLIRDNGLCLSYYARGQDIYNKFYADAIAIFDMARFVADNLNVGISGVNGFISSAHIYIADLPAVQSILETSFS